MSTIPSQSTRAESDLKQSLADEKQDVAVELVDQQVAPSQDEYRSLRRRIDARLLPVMIGTYMIQFYDKTVLNHAALFGILKDLDLTSVTVVHGKTVVDSTRFSYVGMVFYCGYILGVYPATLLGQKFHSGKVCAFLVVIWSIVEVLTVACTSFGGIMAQRFFLGFCEAGIAPTFVIACSQWYTQRESSLRIAIWWSSNGLAVMIGPLTSYGFGSINGALPGWKSIYLWAGLLTFTWSIVVYWTLPDSPKSATFLSERERYVAMERVRDNTTGIADSRIKPTQIREALLDPTTWLLTTLMFGITATNSITGVFSSVIIKSLGFGTLESLCLQIPVGFFGICCGILPNVVVLKTGKWRTVILSTLMGLSIAGTAILYATPHSKTGVVLVGYYFNNFYVGGPNMVLALVAANTAGHTKKSTVNACVFVAYCAGSIMSPLIMKAQDEYHSGFLGILICQVYVIVAAQLLHYVYLRRNKRRTTEHGPHNPGQSITDETDIQNSNFRYST